MKLFKLFKCIYLPTTTLMQKNTVFIIIFRTGSYGRYQGTVNSVINVLLTRYNYNRDILLGGYLNKATCVSSRV